MKTKLETPYEEIISVENLLIAWEEFLKGKRGKIDVQEFELNLMDNILSLHRDLAYGSYKQGAYQAFTITDPKPRNIHKPTVRDRVLHRAIYRQLYPFFDKTFIDDSYSCRKGKGTHKAFMRTVVLTRKVSQNYTKPCFALKCDIRKFFDTIDHPLLIQLLDEYVEDIRLVGLLADIIHGFEKSPGRGMPLGNLTSQLFANIYMNPLDQYVKHRLKTKHYLRYADDFLLLSNDPDELMGCFIEINQFVKDRLKLSLHPNKISLRKLTWGIDFVGYVALPYCELPRRKTVKRMFSQLKYLWEADSQHLEASIQSYLGHMKHASAYEFSKKIRERANC